MPRPRNHLTCSYGVPTDTENASRSPCSASAVHQKVPPGVSVYCWYGLVQSGCAKTRRAVQNRQTRWPSTAPVPSAGNVTPSLA